MFSTEKENQHNLTEVNQVFGNNASIIESDDNYTVQVTLSSGELEGGQEVEATLGDKEILPLDLKEYGYILSGRRIMQLKINGKDLGGYNIFIHPTTQEGLNLASANFADSDKRVVVISSLSEGQDLAILFHEIGHIECGHSLNNRTELQRDLNTYVNEKYIDYNSGTVDTKRLKEDPKAITAIQAIVDQEQSANDLGLELMAKYDGDKLPAKIEFLDNRVRAEYLGVYGF